MVRPAAFGYNEETAVNNAFQQKGIGADIQAEARRESDAYIGLLEACGINVVAAEDTAEPHTPDSVFPNNWFSTHDDGTLVLYPMFAENRRLERKPAVLEAIKANFDVKRILDLTHYEEEGKFLEGTGSMVLDRAGRTVYACRSPRTNEEVLRDFCESLGYSSLMFDASDAGGRQIYHTNVMMHIGSDTSVVCMESIGDAGERARVRSSLEESGRTIVEITHGQMEHFAGNMLELRSSRGEACLVMSKTAHSALSEGQLGVLGSGRRLITPDLDCIEMNGGGSARCMLAELFTK